MRDITPWNPYSELQRVRDDFARLFGPVFPWQSTDQFSHSIPSVDVRETDTHVIVAADVPGVDPDDLDVTITDEALTIRGEVKQEQNTEQSGFRRIERRVGSFQRVIPFPVTVEHDQAVADCRNGVLEVRVPKADPGHSRSIRLEIRKERDGTH